MWSGYGISASTGEIILQSHFQAISLVMQNIVYTSVFNKKAYLILGISNNVDLAIKKAL